MSTQKMIYVDSSYHQEIKEIAIQKNIRMVDLSNEIADLGLKAYKDRNGIDPK